MSKELTFTPSQKKYLRDQLQDFPARRYAVRSIREQTKEEPSHVKAARRLIKRHEDRVRRLDAKASEKKNADYRNLRVAAEDTIAFGTLDEARAAVEKYHAFKF